MLGAFSLVLGGRHSGEGQRLIRGGGEAQPSWLLSERHHGCVLVTWPLLSLSRAPYRLLLSPRSQAQRMSASQAAASGTEARSHSTPAVCGHRAPNHPGRFNRWETACGPVCLLRWSIRPLTFWNCESLRVRLTGRVERAHAAFGPVPSTMKGKV